MSVKSSLINMGRSDSRRWLADPRQALGHPLTREIHLSNYYDTLDTVDRDLRDRAETLIAEELDRPPGSVIPSIGAPVRDVLLHSLGFNALPPRGGLLVWSLHEGARVPHVVVRGCTLYVTRPVGLTAEAIEAATDAIGPRPFRPELGALWEGLRNDAAIHYASLKRKPNGRSWIFPLAQLLVSIGGIAVSAEELFATFQKK